MDTIGSRLDNHISARLRPPGINRRNWGHNRPISRQQAYSVLSTVFNDCEMAGRLGTHSMWKAEGREGIAAASDKDQEAATTVRRVPRSSTPREAILNLTFR